MTAGNVKDVDVHALFDHVVMACPGGPDEPCGHEYSDDELAEWQEASAEGWWNGCPDCHAEVAPEPTKVNRIEQYADARAELDETLAFLRERKPDMIPDLDRIAAEADERERTMLRVGGGA